MTFYRVYVLESYVNHMIVEAESEDDARQLVGSGKGDSVELEYNSGETDPAKWIVEAEE